MLTDILQATKMSTHSVHQFFLLGAVLLVFYFFMIRPQQRRHKKQKEFMQKLEKGVHVVTIGGIHGKIYEIAEHTLTLEVDKKGSKITIDKNALSSEMSKSVS